MGKLITSSPTTLQWLKMIVSGVKERKPSLIYGETKYWASFQSSETNRNCVYLQPQKSQIRLFTKLDLSFDNELQETPASSGWADLLPTVFLIKSERMIGKAIEFIIRSYERDLRL